MQNSSKCQISGEMCITLVRASCLAARFGALKQLLSTDPIGSLKQTYRGWENAMTFNNANYGKDKRSETPWMASSRCSTLWSGKKECNLFWITAYNFTSLGNFSKLSKQEIA